MNKVFEDYARRVALMKFVASTKPGIPCFPPKFNTHPFTAERITALPESLEFMRERNVTRSPALMSSNAILMIFYVHESEV